MAFPRAHRPRPQQPRSCSSLIESMDIEVPASGCFVEACTSRLLIVHGMVQLENTIRKS